MGYWALKANIRGPQGVSIVGTAMRETDGHLLVTLSNGTVIDAGYARGPQGLAGTNANTGDAASASWVAGPGLMATALDAKYAHKTQILVEDYGAVANDPAFDNLPALNLAAQASKISGREVAALGKEYYFKPVPGIQIPVNWKGFSFVGAGEGQTTFKVMSQTTPVNWHGFLGTNTFNADDLSGLNVTGFTFDYNTAGNAVTTPAALDTGVRAVVMVTKGDNINVQLRAINGDGIWVVQAGGTSPATVATHRVNNSRFSVRTQNFGINSGYHDSSAVYFYGDNNTVLGNFHAAASAPGAICAVEVHGDGADVMISVDGWATGVNATGCDFKINRGVSVHNSVMKNVLNGIAIWCVNLVGSTGYAIDGMMLTDNDIELNPDLWSGTGKPMPPGNFAHFGIGISSHGAAADSPMKNVKIADNTIRYRASTTTVPKTLDAGISMVRNATMSGTPSPDVNIFIVDNVIDSPLSAGVVIDLKNTAQNVHADRNSTTNPAQRGITGGVTSAYATGVIAIGGFAMLTVDDCTVVDRRATTIATSAVNAAGIFSTLDARIRAMNPVLSSVTVTPPVIGPTSGGIFTSQAVYGWVAPTGLFAFGSTITDYANNVIRRQTGGSGGQGGSTWAVQP